ncbi:MAG TPA: malate/lactate/ureidoglycolate dehydrogenase [Rubrivivax sp.]|nr:malate/lactate/ureidoglycolate dehydrogenase [Rubrivivax sp.]
MVVQANALRRLAQTIVERGGSLPEEAERVAQHLVDANLAGHDSHGVGMLPRYVDNLLAGVLKPNQQLAVRSDHGALLTLDGQAGYGQAIGVQAMQLGIERARAHGVAVLGLADTHHLGRIGAYAEICVAQGFVSIHFVNVISPPHVAPFGGSDARFATNPMCIGVPLGDARAPMVLDFATSRIAYGKARVAHHRGQPVAAGALIDEAGRPTRDPGTLFREPRGAMLPFGGHKGYGLAVACEILAGALCGGSTLHAAPSSDAIINNMLSFIVDPERLGTAAHLAQEARAFADWVKASPPSRETAVMLPGDPERASRERRSREGIPIDATTWAELLAAGARLGLEEAAMRELAQLG